MWEVLTGRKPWPITLLGGVGTGKSCAALCICDAIGGPSQYYQLAELCDARISASKGQLWTSYGDKMTCEWLWSEWKEAKIAVLDEIGSKEKMTDWIYETTKLAIDKREGMASVFISNIDLESISRIYDDRIASRLSEGTVITLLGDDRRQHRGEHHDGAREDKGDGTAGDKTSSVADQDVR